VSSVQGQEQSGETKYDVRSMRRGTIKKPTTKVSSLATCRVYRLQERDYTLAQGERCYKQRRKVVYVLLINYIGYIVRTARITVRVRNAAMAYFNVPAQWLERLKKITNISHVTGLRFELENLLNRKGVDKEEQEGGVE
jgi:hypothetical protein